MSSEHMTIALVSEVFHEPDGPDQRAVVERARRHYPGYLDVRTELYARAWDEATRHGVAPRIARGHWEE